MRFMWQELQGPEAGTLQAFNQRAAQGNIPGSAADYATLFDQRYERSGGARDAEARAYANDVFGAVGTDAFENLPPNAKFAYSFLTHKGLTPEQAAGVTGRLMVESYARIDPNARNTIDGGAGTYGIAQWRGPRLEALADYAGVSMDDIRNLPISTPEGNYYPTRGIGQTQGAGQMGLLDTQPTQQPQQSGFWGNFAGGILADPDRRARLAMALEGMMLNPNQGVIQAAQAGIEQRQSKSQVNKTMEWLRGQPGGERFAAMADAVGVGPALQLYLESQKAGGKVLTGEQINQMYPGANVPAGNLYNLSPDGKVSQVGGGQQNISFVSESEHDKYIGKVFGQQYEQVQASANASYDMMNTADRLEALMQDPNFISGTGAESIMSAKRIIEILGGNPAEVESMEAFKALSAEMALNKMGGSLGAGFSNADRDFVISMVPNLGTTAAGNAMIIEMMRTIANRNIEIAVLADQYMADHGGRLDSGWNAYLRDWASQNPAFQGAQYIR